MTDDLDVLSRLVDYHDHIAPPKVPVADDVRRGRRRVRRNRTIATGAVAAGVAGVVLAASLVTGADRDSLPEPAKPTPVTPTPAPERSQSPQTWVDTAVDATHDGPDWKVPDPLTAARDGWLPVVTEHLDPKREHLQDLESSFTGVSFEWPGEGSTYSTNRPEDSIYSASGLVGLIVDRNELNPIDGCRYLTRGPKPSNGTESCSAERFTGPDGERARVARYGRRCGAYEGGGPAPATCGDYVVTVAVERRDGLIGYVRVDGRGTPDFNPIAPAAMAALAADPRLTLPETAFAVPSDQAVRSVVEDHLPGFRPHTQTAAATEPPGLAGASGELGRLGINVTVWPAGGTPACGRRDLMDCVERRVYGADDPTTVFVGAWESEHWERPKDLQVSRREFVYVGPRHTVVVWESRVVKADEEPLGAELDQRLIDVVLDARLQQVRDH